MLDWPQPEERGTALLENSSTETEGDQQKEGDSVKKDRELRG